AAAGDRRDAGRHLPRPRDRRALWPADRARLAARRAGGRHPAVAARAALGLPRRRGAASRRARLAVPHRHDRPLRPRPAYRRRAGPGRALVRPRASGRPHVRHPQQHGDAARPARRPCLRDARDDPPPYPHRFRMTDAAAPPAAEAEPHWLRLLPATLALSIAELGPRSLNFLPAIAALGVTGNWAYIVPAFLLFLLFSLLAAWLHWLR